ncbi:unnamed protein product [Blepharisma stoltei]|uniref:Uncharacterized protein n=1 Tax=Blepharisma stoltei TaxID=1481888 RepID=A0AAU9ITY7_9CILI|nr:unnamed protein product [Blepharisma stoltei]
MNIAIEAWLIIASGILRISSFLFDAYYVYSQSFTSDIVKLFCLIFLFAPMALLLTIILYCFIKGLFSKNWKHNCGQFSLGILICIGEPIGLSFFIFGITLLIVKATDRDFYMVDALSRVSNLNDAVLESFPQIILQSYNNGKLDNWSWFTIASVGISALSFTYTCLKLVHDLDKIKHFEAVSQFIRQSVVPSTAGQPQDNINKKSPKESMDVYDFSSEELPR